MHYLMHLLVGGAVDDVFCPLCLSGSIEVNDSEVVLGEDWIGSLNAEAPVNTPALVTAENDVTVGVSVNTPKVCQLKISNNSSAWIWSFLSP